MKTKDNQENVFISHHPDDDTIVNGLSALLIENGHQVFDSLIRVKPANQRRLDEGLVNDEIICRILRRKISWSQTIIVLVGSKTPSQRWVNWVIGLANRLGKRIVGIYEQEGKEADLPEALENYASTIVGWNSECIIEAIEGLENPFEGPGCDCRPAQHYPVSVRC